MDLANVIIRRSGNTPDFNISISPSSTTVFEFKNLLESNGIPANGHRLIHIGVILKDETLLEEYNVRDGSIIHLIKLAQSNQQTVAPNAPIKQPQESDDFSMKKLGSNPLMKRFLDNPDLLKAMIMSNPQVKDIIERNPEYSSIFTDPSFLRQGFEMASNPDKMKEVLRNNDLAISSLEMQPGGFNHLKKLYKSIHEPINKTKADSSTEEKNMRFAKMFGVKEKETKTINSDPLPNPWKAPVKQPTARTLPDFSSMTPGSLFPSSSRGIGGRDSSIFGPEGSGSRGTERGPEWLKNFGQSIRANMDQNVAATPSSTSTSKSQAIQDAIKKREKDIINGLNEMKLIQQQSNSNNVKLPNLSELVPEVEEDPITKEYRFKADGSGIPDREFIERYEEKLKARFRVQLERMNEMGFQDLHENLTMLLATDGDVDSAIEKLIEDDIF
ncbi:hypothetical protein K502DRAFT_340328 [Neoconidiobolus thromboides FSU 785]|nr:hypothetical protein K502DRAFT_340328 [Neoconidiobolus thromboides FSU 785]